MTIDESELEVVCTLMGSGYSLDFTLVSKNHGISTSISIAKGSKINVGTIVQELNERDREISLDKGVAVKKETGKKQATFELMVK